MKCLKRVGFGRLSQIWSDFDYWLIQLDLVRLGRSLSDLIRFGRITGFEYFGTFGRIRSGSVEFGRGSNLGIFLITAKMV